VTAPVHTFAGAHPRPPRPPLHGGVATLISYAIAVASRPQRVIEDLERIREFSDFIMLDCGAFTIRRRGLEVDVDRYAAFAREVSRRGLVDVVVNLDVGSTIDMVRNQRTLESAVRGNAYVMWVYQPFHGERHLRRMLLRYPYVGLGTAGMDSGAHAVVRNDEVARYYVEVFRTLREHDAAAHGFAMTKPTFLLRPDLPWSTVDSSSWTSAARWGFGVLPDERDGTILQVPHPYCHVARSTNLGNRIPTTDFDRTSELLHRYNLSVREWSAMSTTETLVVSALGHYAVEDEVNARRDPAEFAATAARLRTVGLPQLADRRGCFRMVLVVGREENSTTARTAQVLRQRAFDACNTAGGPP